MNSELREKVLEYLRAHPKNGRKQSDIVDGLKMTSSSDFALLSAELQEMEKEYLIVPAKDGQYETQEMAGILEGRISISKNGVGYIDRDGYPTIKVDQRDQLDAMDGDTVIVQCQPWQVYGQVVKILKRSRDHLTATYTDNGHSLRLVPDDEKLRDRPMKVIVPQDVTPVDGTKVFCRIEKYSGPFTLRIEQVMGHKDDPGVDILSVLLDHDIDPEFPEDAIQQANSISQEISGEDKAGREDLTGEITVTIDGDDSKDFDDAVSVKRLDDGYLLKVSIADVSHYVTADSPLDREARRRGCSVYVTDRVVPMLPHILSNGICSLNPHEERLTLTCEMHILPDGTTADYRIYPSFIRSTERMTYKNVNRILDGDEELKQKYSHLGDLFEVLADCADAIRRHRTAKGAIDFGGTEAEIIVDENGKPTDIRPRERGHAERIIEDCMIAANVAVASFMKWQEIPSVYRIHEEPKARRIKDFIRASETMGHKFIIGQAGVYPNEIQRYLKSVEDCEEYPVLSMMMLRCMQKAKYDAACVGHFGLAEEEYLHFTSPIRRYPDLMVHRMLRKYSFEQCLDMQERIDDGAKCAAYAEESSIRERISQDAEYACDDMKKAEYMSARIGKIYDGMITGVQSYGFYVQLENTVEGLVQINTMQDDYYYYDQDRMSLIGERTRRVFTVGMKVKVKVLSASKETRMIDFALFGKNGEIRKKQKTTARTYRNSGGRHTERKGRKKNGRVKH